VIAREKALAEANERISQLEQIIKDTQRAIELKAAGAGGQKGAEKSAAPAQPGSSAIAVAPPPSAPAAKPQDAAPPASTAPATPAPAEHAAAAPPAEVQKGAAPTEPAAAAKPAPKPAPAPEPPKEPSFMSTLLDEPLYLAAGGAAILLGGLAFMVVRRRRHQQHDGDDLDDTPHIAPTFGGPGAVEEIRSGSSTIERAAARSEVGTPPMAARTEPADRVVTHRAADLSPPRPAPEHTAASTAPTPATAPAAATPRTSDDNDLDFHLADRRAAALGLTRENAQREPAARSAQPDLHENDRSHEFKLEPLPPIDAPMEMEKVSTEPRPSVDFKLDLNDLDVNAPTRESGAAGRDDHWHDVQQKFDLAKSYQEMGDKGGARDILQEVLREGDKDQQAQAKKLLESLS